MSLKGHRALITGAGQGIGRACADVFASRGADLVLFEKNSETLDEVAQELGKKGRDVTAVMLDLTDMDKLSSEVKKISSTRLIDIPRRPGQIIVAELTGKTANAPHQ